jgi:signal transduction histidine kinase/pSer/pThr/pTyr-binding forkhead associated (FHA) protein
VPRLIVIKGADEGKQFELAGALFSVGRDAANSIRLHDTEISRRHAEFRPDGDAYRLVDIGSANGTFVNNEQVTDKVLSSGDQVRVGQTVLVYSAGRAAGKSDSDLAERISLITRHDVELSSAIVKTIGETEGSRILARPDQVDTIWLRESLANLGVMYEAIQAVSHILDVDQLLERIIDLIFRSIAADHGCIMLRNPDDDQLVPKAARWRNPVAHEETLAVSRTIIDHVLRERQGILVTDATHDARFSGGQSIVRFGIREVICVPMKGRHETLGVLYLDTHTGPRELVRSGNETGQFTEDHLKFAIAIAHQAALAVEETRYHHAMVQAERLAAIGQTVAALSHHIKNILQGLRSGGEIVHMGLAAKDEPLLRKGWAIVEKNQGKIYELVMDMLSYSKEREPSAEPTDLNRLARDVVELMQGRAKELHCRLETQLAPSLPLVPADSEGIHRALLNVVGNALDAVEGRKDGEVRVTTEAEDDGEWVRVVVTDNGSGIPPQKLADIFRPFVSTMGARGTGLGLAVSRKILREHGGDIEVESKAGEGSRFFLRLPLRSPLGPEGNSVTGTFTAARPPRPED